MISNFAIHSFLLQRLGSKAHILELGSGEGTAWLAERFEHVTTVEHNSKWLNLTNRAQYIYAPLVPYEDAYFRDATHWYDQQVIATQLPSDYDAVLIDGPNGCYGRGGFYTYFDLFRHDVLYVFDDVHRMWDYRLMGRIAQRLNLPAHIHPGTDGYRWYGYVDARPFISSK